MNEEWTGQVVCGFEVSSSLHPHIVQPQLFRLPSVVDLYQNIRHADDKLPTELSCAERAESAPQNIYTNQMAATLIMGFCNIIIDPDSDGLTYHAVNFDAKTGTTFRRTNTRENLEKFQ